MQQLYYASSLRNMLQVRGLNTTERLVLLILALHANGNVARITVPQIAELAEMDERSIYRALGSLRDKEMVGVGQRSGERVLMFSECGEHITPSTSDARIVMGT